MVSSQEPGRFISVEMFFHFTRTEQEGEVEGAVFPYGGEGIFTSSLP